MKSPEFATAEKFRAKNAKETKGGGTETIFQSSASLRLRGENQNGQIRFTRPQTQFIFCELQ